MSNDFGHSVAIDDNIIGSPYDGCTAGVAGDDCGFAYIFREKNSFGAIPTLLMYLLN
jgi:hypothetical protein